MTWLRILTHRSLEKNENFFFADDTFKWIFVNENGRISIKLSLKFVPKSPINNTPALVQTMAWRRPGEWMRFRKHANHHTTWDIGINVQKMLNIAPLYDTRPEVHQRWSLLKRFVHSVIFPMFHNIKIVTCTISYFTEVTATGLRRRLANMTLIKKIAAILLLHENSPWRKNLPTEL